MFVEIDLQGITGEGITLPRFTVEIPQDMLMKIGRLIAMQKGLVPGSLFTVTPNAELRGSVRRRTKCEACAD